MSTIGEKIINYYKGDRNLIVINSGEHVDIEIEDLISLIHIANENEETIIFTKNFCVKMFDYTVNIKNDVEKPEMYAALSIISTPEKYVDVCSSVRDFKGYNIYFSKTDEDKFLKLASETRIIDYNITRYIMKAFNITYTPDTKFGKIYLEDYVKNKQN